MRRMYFETNVGELLFETDDDGKWSSIISTKRIYDIALVIFLIERFSTIIRFDLHNFNQNKNCIYITILI